MTHKKGLLLIPIVVLVISGWAGIDVALRLDRIPGSVSEIVLQPDVWPKSSSEVTFAVIGDAGTGGVQQFRVASQMAQTYRSEPFGLLLTTGDNVYFGRVVNRVQDVVDKPYRPLFGAGVEFRPALGNHDLARIHRCGAALGLEQGVRAVGRDGPRSIPINGAGGGLWLSLGAPMAVLGSGAGAG